MTAHDNLVAWADYCAKLARDTPGPQFSEPLLTEIRLGWDRVIAGQLIMKQQDCGLALGVARGAPRSVSHS